MAGEVLDNQGRGEVSWRWPSIHPEARKFAAIAAVLCLIFAFLAWETLAWPMGALTLGILAFFRDPQRLTPLREGLVVSPADGVVCSIGFFLPPAELGLGAEPMQRVSIFMSVFDVHVNRAPITGRITKVAYKPGIFLNADLDKASEDNERNSLVISTPQGRIGVVQIAGLVARRIVSFVKEGQSIGAGERFGLIRFGSRLDVYLPDGTPALVAEGQTAIAGETILADMYAHEAGPTFRTN